MTTYQVGSPNGWMGPKFDADSDEQAVVMYRENGGDEVLDIMGWHDEYGQPCILLVVADEIADGFQKCVCSHFEIDHVCDYPASEVSVFRPCFNCDCLGYKEAT